MELPQHWVTADGFSPHLGQAGGTLTVWGWSTVSEADAVRVANQRLTEALARVAREGGLPAGHGYYPRVPLREPVRAEMVRRPFEQTEGPLLDPWPLDRWPDVPTRVVAGGEDRLFPLDFTTALARERNGVEPDVIDAGHLAALAAPDALVDVLDRYAGEVIGG